MEFIEELRFLKEQMKFKEKVEVPRGISNIVIAGMGGSGIAAMIFQEFYSKLPVTWANDYRAPDFVSESTLFIAISYSGNTEETLSATNQAIRKKAHVVTISAGGKLQGIGTQHIAIPRTDMQPRSASGYMLIPILAGFGLFTELEADGAYKFLADLDADNAKCLAHAKAIYERSAIPVIYGPHPYKGVAYRWKTQFNENSKVLGYSNSFPELNHNDTMAIAQTYLKDKFYFMAFESGLERITKRIDVTQSITGSRFATIKPKGSSDIERMFYLLHYGDYVSYHLGRLRGVDPTDVSLIEQLKKNIA